MRMTDHQENMLLENMNEMRKKNSIMDKHEALNDHANVLKHKRDEFINLKKRNDMKIKEGGTLRVTNYIDSFIELSPKKIKLTKSQEKAIKKKYGKDIVKNRSIGGFNLLTVLPKDDDKKKDPLDDVA